MPRAEQQHDHLSDYERSICYYTLPRVVHPVTYGLIIAYAVCLFEALGALCIGILFDHDTWTTAGAAALAAIVVFGLIAFFTRALIYEVRQRRLLAEAKGVPDAGEEPGDLPDPFEDHILIKRPAHLDGQLFCCTGDDDGIFCFVERAAHGAWWRMKTPYDSEICRAKALRRSQSFGFDVGWPSRLVVLIEAREVGWIQRLLTLSAPCDEVRIEEAGMLAQSPEAQALPLPRTYTIRQEAILYEGRTVGRFYGLRQSQYLDIEAPHLNEAILAFFVARR